MSYSDIAHNLPEDIHLKFLCDTEWLLVKSYKHTTPPQRSDAEQK